MLLVRCNSLYVFSWRSSLPFLGIIFIFTPLPLSPESPFPSAKSQLFPKEEWGSSAFFLLRFSRPARFGAGEVHCSHTEVASQILSSRSRREATPTKPRFGDAKISTLHYFFNATTNPPHPPLVHVLKVPDPLKWTQTSWCGWLLTLGQASYRIFFSVEFDAAIFFFF